MNLDDVMAGWHSQDAAPFAVDKTLLHEVLRQEQAKLEKQRRRMRWFIYAANAVLFLTAVLFLAIMVDPNQPLAFSARLIVWDYVVGGIGVAAALILAGALFAVRRSQQAREARFGDSLRDHLRRRIAQLDAEITGEHRLELIMVAAALTCATAISVVSGRIKHVPVPWGDILSPSPSSVVLILGFFYLVVFRWVPRERQLNVQRKTQLEALLEELDGP